MLLEAYFAQIDGISQKLYHVCSLSFSHLRTELCVGNTARCILLQTIFAEYR